MREELKIIAWFGEVGKGDIASVGGKGANLGELTRFGVPVPPGFVVTADAYFYFLRESKLLEMIRQILKPLDPDDSEQLQKIASQIKEIISTAPMLPRIAEEIRQAYRSLGEGLVAVRSSATAEDLPEASFAGQQRTFLNVQGEDAVVTAVQECWASLFEPRAIFYRHQQAFDHSSVGIAVPVQKMVQADASGVMFTVEPLTNDRTKILIEAIWGLGEAIVSGEVTPDLYVLRKNNLEIVEKKMFRQEWQLVRNLEEGVGRGGSIEQPILPPDQEKQKLTDEDIILLAKMGRQIEERYNFPQDIEWAKQDKQLFVVQTRPVTTLGIGEGTRVVEEVDAVVLLSGIAASPGIAVGPVRIIPEASQIHRVAKGDVLVAEMTTPDFVPAMKRAAAIVTDRGGRTAHAAIVSRELGIPCVAGTEQATKMLSDGEMITVDGSRGKVYAGEVKISEEAPVSPPARGEQIKTRTRVYVNLAEPELADAVASRDVDGVGLLRAEFMITQIGEHPRFMLNQGRGNEFVAKLAEGIGIFAKAFDSRPVVYRTTDFKTNEYKNLRGGEKYEGIEENPMLGYRGCSRYIEELDVFRLEIEAIKKVREKYKNVWVMIPFVRTVNEIAESKKVLESEGLRRAEDFKLWMMVEVPSNVLLIDKFLDTGIDGISIGSNDLTQLILGVDRDNEKLSVQFDEMNEAVLLALERVIKTSVSRGVTASICGQAPSVYPELTEKLVEWGITSVSVSPDMINKTRAIIADVEARLVSSPHI